jgi:sulfur carrier protein
MISETGCQIRVAAGGAPLLSMNVVINGQPREIPEGQSIRALLLWLNLDPARVAVELDGQIVKQPEWPSRVLTPGARLEIVHFVGGG